MCRGEKVFREDIEPSKISIATMRSFASNIRNNFIWGAVTTIKSKRGGKKRRMSEKGGKPATTDSQMD